MAGRNPRTTAQIAGHPLHPMLIPFPIAFLVATLFCDIVFWASGNPAWAAGALYLLSAALFMAALAAIAGFVDFFGEARIRELTHAWHHMIGNVIVVLLSLANLALRLAGGATAVLPTGIVVSLVVVLILLYTGWRGGDLVYKHRVAVSEEDH